MSRARRRAARRRRHLVRLGVRAWWPTWGVPPWNRATTTSLFTPMPCDLPWTVSS
jgi:hypothetical protein